MMKTVILCIMISAFVTGNYSVDISTHTDAASSNIVKRRDTIYIADTIHITTIPVYNPKSVEIPSHLLMPHKVANPIDGFTLSPQSGVIGIGISLNIQRIYQRYFEKSTIRQTELTRKELLEGYIDQVWLPLTASYTGLDEENLRYFRIYYRPNIEFITQQEHHDRVGYVIGKVKNYKDSLQHIRHQVNTNIRSLANDD